MAVSKTMVSLSVANHYFLVFSIIAGHPPVRLSTHHHYQEYQQNDYNDGQKNKLIISFFQIMTPDHT